MIAAQASSRLLLCFLLGHAVLYSFEITDSLTGLALCQVHSSTRSTVVQTCLRDLHITGDLMMISQILVDIGRNYLRRRDRLDNRRRPARTVASREYAGHILERTSALGKDLASLNRDSCLFCPIATINISHGM